MKNWNTDRMHRFSEILLRAIWTFWRCCTVFVLVTLKLWSKILNIIRHKINWCGQWKIEDVVTVECCRRCHFISMALCSIESFHYFNNHNENAVKYFSAKPQKKSLFVLVAFNFISGKPMRKRIHIAWQCKKC